MGMLDDPCEDCGGTGILTCADCGNEDADDATENGAYCLACQAEMDAGANEQLNHMAAQAAEDEHDGL